jgi:4-alpha-glucanotransferase
VQDLLGLDSKARMNVPGTVRGNWTWRFMRGQVTKTLARQLATQTALVGRG